MANERLRTALARDGWLVPAFAESLGVDPKTIERWITKNRTPHRKTALAAARLLKEDPSYLWPDLSGRVGAADGKHGEVVTVYTERSAVPASLYLSLLRDATDSIDVLVYAGLHLPEANPTWAKELVRKCDESVKVRMAFGDPDSESVRARGDEEGVGAGLAARINYSLTWHRELLDCPEAQVGFHPTVLYNSILRFDDQMLVNPHIYSMPAFRAPVLHLRKIPGCPLFETYAECFERVWSVCRSVPRG